MAIDAKTTQLLERLILQTERRKIPWQRTVTANLFQAAFPGYSVQIESDGAHYAIRIINEEGEIVDEFSDIIIGQPLQTPSGLAGPSRAMGELYSTARRIALGTGKAIDDLLSALDKEE